MESPQKQRQPWSHARPTHSRLAPTLQFRSLKPLIPDCPEKGYEKDLVNCDPERACRCNNHDTRITADGNHCPAKTEAHETFFSKLSDRRREIRTSLILACETEKEEDITDSVVRLEKYGMVILTCLMGSDRGRRRSEDHENYYEPEITDRSKAISELWASSSRGPPEMYELFGGGMRFKYSASWNGVCSDSLLHEYSVVLYNISVLKMHLGFMVYERIPKTEGGGGGGGVSSSPSMDSIDKGRLRSEDCAKNSADFLRWFGSDLLNSHAFGLYGLNDAKYGSHPSFYGELAKIQQDQQLSKAKTLFDDVISTLRDLKVIANMREKEDLSRGRRNLRYYGGVSKSSAESTVYGSDSASRYHYIMNLVFVSSVTSFEFSKYLIQIVKVVKGLSLLDVVRHKAAINAHLRAKLRAESRIGDRDQLTYESDSGICSPNLHWRMFCGMLHVIARDMAEKLTQRGSTLASLVKRSFNSFVPHNIRFTLGALTERQQQNLQSNTPTTTTTSSGGSFFDKVNFDFDFKAPKLDSIGDSIKSALDETMSDIAMAFSSEVSSIKTNLGKSSSVSEVPEGYELASVPAFSNIAYNDNNRGTTQEPNLRNSKLSVAHYRRSYAEESAKFHGLSDILSPGGGYDGSGHPPEFLAFVRGSYIVAPGPTDPEGINSEYHHHHTSVSSPVLTFCGLGELLHFGLLLENYCRAASTHAWVIDNSMIKSEKIGENNDFLLMFQDIYWPWSKCVTAIPKLVNRQKVFAGQREYQGPLVSTPNNSGTHNLLSCLHGEWSDMEKLMCAYAKVNHLRVFRKSPLSEVDFPNQYFNKLGQGVFNGLKSKKCQHMVDQESQKRVTDRTKKLASDALADFKEALYGEKDISKLQSSATPNETIQRPPSYDPTPVYPISNPDGYIRLYCVIYNTIQFLEGRVEVRVDPVESAGRNPGPDLLDIVQKSGISVTDSLDEMVGLFYKSLLETFTESSRVEVGLSGPASEELADSLEFVFHELYLAGPGNRTSVPPQLKALYEYVQNIPRRKAADCLGRYGMASLH